MVLAIIAILVAVLLWLVAVFGIKPDDSEHAWCALGAFLFTVLSALCFYTAGAEADRGKIASTSAIETGRIYRLVGQFPGPQDKGTGLVLDDGSGNFFAVWNNGPVPNGAQYFQKKDVKEESKGPQLVPVVGPLPSATVPATTSK